MITVRFPNGQAVRYNNLNWVQWEDDGTALLKKDKDAGWSVSAPRECLIEFTLPSSVSNPLLSPEESIDICIANIRSFSAYKLGRLKILLQKFNRHTSTWKAEP